jgi:pantothenate kinase
VITDKAGNPIYMPTSTSPSSTTYSNYSGAREYSIYLDARRHSLFEWYAVRTVGRRNNNTPLRVDDLHTYDANTHLLVDQYMEMYENIWKVILAAEGNRYVVQK